MLERLAQSLCAKKVKKCAEAAALATGAKMKVRDYANTLENMITNHALAEAMRNNWEKIGVKVQEGVRLAFTRILDHSRRLSLSWPRPVLALAISRAFLIASSETSRTQRRRSIHPKGLFSVKSYSSFGSLAFRLA